MTDCEKNYNADDQGLDLRRCFEQSWIGSDQTSQADTCNNMDRQYISRVLGWLNFILFNFLKVLLRDRLSDWEIDAAFRSEGLYSALDFSKIPSRFVLPFLEWLEDALFLTFFTTIFLQESTAIQILCAFLKSTPFWYYFRLPWLYLLHIIKSFLLL